MVTTLGERLRTSIERWTMPDGRPGSIRGFQRLMQERLAGRYAAGRGGKAGSSYPAINSYLADASTPSLEWLHEAAEALGVRPAWLILDIGARTEAEELARREAEARKPPIPEHIQQIWAGIEAGFPSLRITLDGRGQLANLWARTYQLAVDTGALPPPETRPYEIAKRIGRAAAAPLVELGVEPSTLSEWRLNMFSGLIARALMCVLADPYELNKINPPREG